MSGRENEGDASGDDVGGGSAGPPADQKSVPCPPGMLLECLYRLHYNALVRHALTFVAEPHTAEDACHTVFLRLLQREDRPAEITLGYLRTAVRPACFDHQKRVRRLTPLSPGWDHPAPPLDDLEEAAAVHELVARLLDILPEKSRAVVELRLDEMSYREIAGKLGIPSKTVDTILTRARERLRPHLLAERERERERVVSDGNAWNTLSPSGGSVGPAGGPPALRPQPVPNAGTRHGWTG